MKIQADFFGSLRLGDLLKISIFKKLAGSQMAPLEGGVGDNREGAKSDRGGSL